MISTRDLSLLPDVDRLRSTLQSMAMLDAILSRDWWLRYYSFDFPRTIDEQMAEMKNGSGDEFYALFRPAGCLIKGFAHESAMAPYRHKPPAAWPGVLNAVPPEFADCLTDPVFRSRWWRFEPGVATFCVWR